MRILLAIGVIVVLTAVPVGAKVDHTTWVAPETVAVPSQPCDQPGRWSGTCRGYFPDLARKSDGTLLLAYYWSDQHVGSFGQIRMRTSSDDGATWSAPRIIADDPANDLRDPSLTVLRSGRILLSYFRYTNGLQTFVRHSDDGGATFVDPTPVSPQAMPQVATTAKIAELSNGDLLIPVYGRQSGATHFSAALVRSTDGGLTWTGGEKVVATGVDFDFTEPAVAELEPGHVRVLLRTTNGDLGYQTDSYDDAYLSDWTAPWSLGVPMHAPEFFRVPGTNKVPYIWSQPGPSSRAVVVRMRYLDQLFDQTQTEVLYDDTTTWGGGWAGDMGYSSTVLLDDQRLRTALYDAKRGVVLVVPSRLADWEGAYDEKLDLAGEYAAGTIEVDTDMTWSDPDYPTAGVAAAFDGSTAYFNSAAKPEPGAAYYTIDLATPREIGKVSICLKPRNGDAEYAESATVSVSADGEHWQRIATYVDARTNELDSVLLGRNLTVRFVRVEVSEADGWAVLNEIQLFRYRAYGFGHSAT